MTGVSVSENGKQTGSLKGARALNSLLQLAAGFLKDMGFSKLQGEEERGAV